MRPYLKLNVELMDNEHLSAVNRLKSLLEPFTELACHYHNVDLARITFPINTIPYDVDKEIWKPIENKAFIMGRYMISSWGRVYDNNNCHYLKSHLCDKGYIRVALQRSELSEAKTYSVSTRIHRLVGQAFLPNIEDKDTVNHINLDKTNNTLKNLEWATNLENVEHSINNGARINWGGYTYLTEKDVEEIKVRYKNGELMKDIAKTFNRTHKAISNIIHGKTYKPDFWANVGRH